MCGIAGMIGRLSEPNRAAVARMCGALAHRGPDGEGFWESPADERGFGALLGHRRLAIIDLSPGGAQPMADPASGNVIAYNGELYNFETLREDLAARGEQFRSTSDTEVLLRGLSTEGERFLDRMRGMFAFALWSAGERQLMLVRDPLGIKPLYIARNPDPAGEWSMAFASELRALLVSRLLPSPRLHPQAAASVAWNGYMVRPSTAVEGVELLGAGEVRMYDLHGHEREAREYWSIRTPTGPLATEEELEQELQKSVALHLVSDVPVALFLSGGVDSAAVANLAKRGGANAIHTFTLGFEEEEYSEGADARRIAEAIGTEHQEVVLTESDFIGRLDEAVSSLDQPTFDGLNAFYMSHAVRQAGFKVALVGTGGDELFGGYTSFRDLPVMQRWNRRAGRLGRAAGAGAANLYAGLKQRRSKVAFPPQTRWAKLSEMMRAGEDLLSLYQLAYALFLPNTQRDLVPGDTFPNGLPPQQLAKLRREISGRTPLPALSILEQRLFLGERLLRDNDAASMAASIEQRLPLVDRFLFEAADRLDDNARYHPAGKKAALRRIGLRGLDPALFAKPKRGFVLPFDRWIRRGLEESVAMTLNDHAAVEAAGFVPAAVQRLWRGFVDGAPGLYWSRVWAIYVHVRWCAQHGVRA